MRRLIPLIAFVAYSATACTQDQPVETTDARLVGLNAALMSPTSFAPGQLVRVTSTATVRDQPKASSASVGTASPGVTAVVVKRGIVDSVGDGTTYFLLAEIPGINFGGWISEVSLEAAGSAPTPSGCCYAAPPPLGDEGNSGTFSSPWTLQKALNAGVVPQGNDLWLRGGITRTCIRLGLAGLQLIGSLSDRSATNV